MHELHRFLPYLLLAPLLLPPAPRIPAGDDGGSAPLPAQEEADDEEAELTPLERARRHALRNAREAGEPVLGPGGEEIVPGQLPAGATAEARARWEALQRRILSGDGEPLAPKPIESFHLAFYCRQRSWDPPQSNDFDLEFQFLAPAYLRAKLESGTTHLRGPDGDYVITKEEVYLVPVGRDGEVDRRQIDEMAAIARNFIGLTDPRTLRIVELTALAEPPAELPPRFLAEAKPLQWLAVKSPDFFLLRTDRSGGARGRPVYLARLGFDPGSGDVHLALIHEDRGGVAAIETAMLIRLQDHRRRSRFLVPHRIERFDVDASVLPWRFQDRPTTELTLRRDVGRVGARLSPADFLPPPPPPK